MELEQDAPHRSHMVHAGCDLMSESGPAVQSAGIPIGASSDEPRGAGSDRSSYVASGGHLAAECAQLHRNAQSRAGDESRNRGWGREGSDALATRRGESRNPRRSIGGGLVKGAAVLMGVVSMGMVGGVRGCSSTLSLMPGSASSPAYANMFEVWDDPTAPRTSSSPVTFRVQCHTEMGWEVAVTGGCQALGYWSAEKALLLRTDPGRCLPGTFSPETLAMLMPRLATTATVTHTRTRLHRSGAGQLARFLKNPRPFFLNSWCE